MNPEVLAQIEILSNVVDELDYYQILKVAPTAGPAEIKAAFHTESREYHPDNFGSVTDPALRERILKVAKRLTEAYTVLRDHDKRRRYDAVLSLPEGQRRIRYTEEDEHKKSQAEETFKTAQGKKLYQQGMIDLKAGRFAQAEKSFKLALAYEPSNDTIKKAAEEAAAKIPVKSFAIK
ncbi:MAG: J domain-containing protein [Deltaproteobacteria bacterium]|nr:J domain-containing protein [Deltaproteobacteria bacterium]